MADEDTLWRRDVAGAARAGELIIDPAELAKIKTALHQTIARVKGIRNLALGVPTGRVSSFHDGRDIGERIHLKSVSDLAQVLHAHTVVLDDMADVMHVVQYVMGATERHNKKIFDLTIPDRQAIAAENIGVPEEAAGLWKTVKPGRQLVNADEHQVNWDIPQTKTYAQLYDLGQHIDPTIVTAAQALWYSMTTKLTESFGELTAVLDASHRGWAGEGASAARRASGRYIDDVGKLTSAMNGVTGKLQDIFTALLNTRHAMPQTPPIPEGTVVTPEVALAVNQQKTRTPGYQLAMMVNYTTPLLAATGFDELPRPTSPVSGTSTDPSTQGLPGANGLTGETGTGPGNTDVPGRPGPPSGPGLAQDPTAPGNGTSPVGSGEPEMPGDSGKPGATGDGPGDSRLASAIDAAADKAGRENGDRSGLGDLGQRSTDSHALAAMPGNAAGRTGDAAKSSLANSRPLAAGLRAGAAGPGSGPRAGDLTKQALAQRMFPRAGLPAEELAGRTRAGLPGAPGVPGVPVSRRGDGGEEGEHKSADYLNSEEHLNEAIGPLAPIYRPVVDR
ncbi:hypothetical protein [Nocardia sp. NPDC052566]|uniref:hypothetical protein n=1 Tax=Nocardia sp. NPDC052566 TaxID=3364330 RepID=UPI0037CACA48